MVRKESKENIEVKRSALVFEGVQRELPKVPFGEERKAQIFRNRPK